jgi:hypothetical protein
MPPKKRKLPQRVGGKFKKTQPDKPDKPESPALEPATSSTPGDGDVPPVNEVIVIPDDGFDAQTMDLHDFFLDDPNDGDFEFDEAMLDEEDKPPQVKKMWLQGDMGFQSKNAQRQ